MEGRKKMEEFYRKLKVGMKLKYAFTTVIVTFAVAMVVSLVSIDSHRNRSSGFLHCHPDHHYRNYAKANSGTGRCS